MNKRGILVVISGPSGVGKGTIIAELLKGFKHQPQLIHFFLRVIVSSIPAPILKFFFNLSQPFFG